MKPEINERPAERRSAVGVASNPQQVDAGD
jgi:hypothetical protein